MELTKAVGMTDEEFVDFVATRSKFGQLNFEFVDHPIMESFSRDKAISMVFSGNKLENTLPRGVKHSIHYVMLDGISLDGHEIWAGNSGPSASQLVQHLKASLKKLMWPGPVGDVHVYSC